VNAAASMLPAAPSAIAETAVAGARTGLAPVWWTVEGLGSGYLV
jgi:hypothetical protein